MQLIYQNSEIEQQLDKNIDRSKVILINNHTSLQTGLPYKTLGEIYKDALTFVPEDVDVINFFDDDDIFLPNHVSKGVEGLLKGKKTAYKPSRSYYRGGGKVVLVNNTLEPSIFVRKSHVVKYGFSNTTSDQHLKWVQGLLPNDIFVDEVGTPTLCYNWGDSFHTFKTSGNSKNPDNFNNYRKSSLDHGDRVITPLEEERCNVYYNLIKNAYRAT